MKKWLKPLGICIVSLGLFLSLFTPYNFAQTENRGEAVVVNVVGSAKMLRGSWWNFWRWHALLKGQELLPGDRIHVGKNGDIEIQFYNGSQVRILENTTVIIGESSVSTVNEDRKDRSSSIFVKSGEVWVQVEKTVSKVLRFKVETPNAVAGVRGTSFIVNVQRNISNVFVDEGLVEVQQKKSCEFVMVQGGYTTRVIGKAKPEAVQKIDESRRIKLKVWAEQAKKAIENGSFLGVGSKEDKEKKDKDKDKDKEEQREEKDTSSKIDKGHAEPANGNDNHDAPARDEDETPIKNNKD